MVNISIIVEGGANDTNASMATIDNSNALRESLYRVFSQALNRNDISIEVHMGAGNRNAARAFVGAGTDTFLYTDLDTDASHRGDWFIKMSTGTNPINIPDAKISYIFFMIQEMEAWILKQPEAIEQWAAANNFKRYPEAIPVAQHRHIAGLNIEEISKPSDKLADILKQTFQSDKKRKNGKSKGVIYGKLKYSHELLDQLNISKLVLEDNELMSFCNKVREVATAMKE